LIGLSSSVIVSLSNYILIISVGVMN